MNWLWPFGRSSEPAIREMRERIARGEGAIAAQKPMVDEAVKQTDDHLADLRKRVERSLLSDGKFIRDLTEGWHSNG